MRRTDTSKTAVWRWQERFMTDGVSGLMRNKTRPSRNPPLSTELEQHVVARTLEDPPGETKHWTALKPRFTDALKIALAVYPEARVDIEKQGLIIPPPRQFQKLTQGFSE